jgi:hypothetical protein
MSHISVRALQLFCCVQERDRRWFLVSFLRFSLKKDPDDMLNIRKHERLPESMALAETADGTWFAACASLSERPPRVYLLEDPPLIPPALDSFDDQRSGYLCREEARDACHTWCEAAELTQEWWELAARTELYPERTVWYLDEIARLTGDDTPLLHHGLPVQAVVHARGKNGLEIIAATGDTPDEAIEALYQCVYEWSRMLQAAACARSKPPIL